MDALACGDGDPVSALFVLGCCALSAVWLRPWRTRPRPLVEPLPTAHRDALRSTGRSARRPRSRSAGRSEGRSTGRATGRSAGRPGSTRRRALLVGVILGVVMVGLSQPVLVIPLLLVYAVVVRRRRRAATDDHADVVRALPEVVDLVLVGVGAGLTPRETLHRCQSWLPDPFAEAVAGALSRAASGATFADALDRGMTPLGDRVRPLVAALNAGERDHAMLAPSLLRVSDEARRQRRVAAQERARRVPVAMLGPLLLCVLPSFALLTLAPLILGSLSDLGVVV